VTVRPGGLPASRRDLVLGLLGAPALWMLHFGLSYFLVTLACARVLPAPGTWLLAATVVAILTSVWLGVMAGRRLFAGVGAALPGVERFLALGAVWLTAGFALVLLLEGALFLALDRWCG
jgi:hypothetical protein